MSAQTAQLTTYSPQAKKSAPFSKPITWDHFKNKYLSREDGYTYEWVNGFVEKTKRTMDALQVTIVENLMDLFIDLRASGKVTGLLTNEIDTFFLGQHRRPDLSYLTKQQMRDTKLGIYPVPNFVIEIISNNDKSKRVQEKMVNYWASNVEVIWHIFPDLEHVHVYNGKKMTVFMKDEICSAAPVLPEFEISVNDIFQ